MVRIYLILILILFVCPKGFSQQDLKLSDGWEFYKGDFSNIWEVVRYAKEGQPESVPVWQEVTLPHCYNSSDAVNPDVNYYQGPGWYRKYMKFNNPFKNGRTLLHFEGAGQKTEVYLFNEKVASHVGGYDEWTIDITDVVNRYNTNSYIKEHYDGKIPLVIRTDNSRDVEMIPSDLSDFNLYGGLYRNVHVKYVPEVYIENIKINPNLSQNLKKGNLTISIDLKRYKQQDCLLEVTIKDKEGKIVKTTESKVSSANEKFSVIIEKPLLWSPLSPNLYSCVVEIQTPEGKQEVTTSFGFRTYKFIDKGPFVINGERLLIKGMSRHEDHAGVAAAMSYNQIKKEMLMLKEMGANFIRLGHYQQSGQVLQLCDSLGILVWEEIPWCRGGLGGEKYKAQTRRMLRNLITQHYNHPAVIIWGLGNENDWAGDFPEFDKDSIRTFMQELNTLAHELDPERVTGIRRCDFCKDIVDVYSPSIWAGWYRGKFTEYKNVSRKEFDKVDHFIHMEWGASSHARRHSENPDIGLEDIATGQGADERDGDASLLGGKARVSKDGDWTETYACNLIDWHLKEQETMEWLTGAAYWIFKDFSTPVRPDNPIPYVNQKGVLQRDLTPKESYYLFQSYWAKTPMAYIYGHTWPVRWGSEGEEKLLKVYSNCEKAELFLNNQNLGMKTRDSQDYPAAGLRWKTPFKEGVNQVKVRAYQGDIVIEDSIEFIYETRKWGLPEKVEYEIKQLNENESEIEIIAVDKQGVICLDSKNWVKFSYVGSGKMEDNMGTYGGSHKIQLANGRATIRVTHRNSQGVLCVSVDGLNPVFITVNNQK